MEVAAAAETAQAPKKRLRKPRDVYTYDPDKFGVPLAFLRDSIAAAHTDVSFQNKMDVYFQDDVAPRTWYSIGARLHQPDLQPYIKSRNMDLLITMYELLPSYIPLHHPGMSLFFAGTRYDELNDSGFQFVRGTLGTIVASCVPTPSFTDVLLLLQSFPVFMHNQLYEQYRAREGLQRVHDLFKGLDVLLEIFADHLVESFRENKPPTKITVEQYDALGAMAPFDAIKFLQDLSFARTADSEQKYVVYGRYKPLETSHLRPCPFTVKAVEALHDAKLPYSVVEVASAADPAVPITKPATHTTVPVVFLQRHIAASDDLLEFIGGYTDLVAHIESAK